MKAYKGFNKNMTCKNFQFEEGGSYQEQRAKLCESGFHACLNPLDCLNYYPICDSVFHEVELDGVSDERNPEDTKVAAKKITVGAKLDIAGMVKGAIDFVFSSVNKNADGAKADTGNYAQMASSGDNAKMASSGYNAQMASSGYNAQMASSGYNAKMASSGDNAQMASSGYNAQMASSGDNAQMASSGDNAKMQMDGDFSVGAAIGYNAKIRGKVGCWITLAEYYNDGKVRFVKSAMIDGKKIKADTWYRLKNKKIVEAEV